MLEDLTIKNFALIDSDYLEFKNGFTVLSGETGAGKSILIGALSFLLGGKAEVQQIRAGKTEATVSGTFYINDLDVRSDINEDDEPCNATEWLIKHNIEIENKRVILRRFIRATGKSGAWINDTPVTRSDLTQFSSFLVDIHGQHEHQSLMKVGEHRKFLDARAGISTDVNDFTKLYAQLVAKRKLLEEYSLSEGERLRNIDMFSFAVKEIESAKLKVDEDVELEEELARLSSFEKIYSDVENINDLLTASDSGVLSLLKKCMRDSSHLLELDKSVAKLNERVESSFYELSDLANEFSSYKSGLVFDPARMHDVEERLSLIYGLKKKYASSVNASISEVFSYYDKAKLFIEENSEGNSKEDVLKREIKALEKEVLEKAEFLSNRRKKTAQVLNCEVDDILSRLGMGGTRFTINITGKSGTELHQVCGPYGKDNVEFLISSNPGNPPMPLARIASGGELSRVMLALKTIFAQTDSVETLIFDEIDTGIGGEVAVAVGAHMKKLAQNRQIFCITHLASIAVYADNQIKIEKSVSGDVTSSNVICVEGEDRVIEIARMLSGDANTEQSLQHARTLLEKYSGGV